jgi:hypothetical protein
MDAGEAGWTAQVQAGIGLASALVFDALPIRSRGGNWLPRRCAPVFRQTHVLPLSHWAEYDPQPFLLDNEWAGDAQPPR